MRVVLDTNVLISGIFFGGLPTQILDRWTRGQMAESHDNLSVQWQAMLPELCHIIPDKISHQKISRDSDDDKFILCAINSAAQYLITGDMDLKVLTGEYNFKIIPPRQFVNILDK